eukprot:gene958-1300_t
MLGDEDVVLVLSGEHAAGIELHAERGDVGAEIQHRRRELGALVTHGEFRVRHIALVAIGIAEVFAHLRDHVELVARQVVADPVAGVFGEPVFAGAWIDIAANAVAHAERNQFGIAGLRINTTDLRQRGIDIRDGQQLECITCALCIDACDGVMDKLGRERGLIAYATLSDYADNMALATNGNTTAIDPAQIRNADGKFISGIKHFDWRVIF